MAPSASIEVPSTIRSLKTFDWKAASAVFTILSMAGLFYLQGYFVTKERYDREQAVIKERADRDQTRIEASLNRIEARLDRLNGHLAKRDP